MAKKGNYPQGLLFAVAISLISLNILAVVVLTIRGDFAVLNWLFGMFFISASLAAITILHNKKLVAEFGKSRVVLFRMAMLLQASVNIYFWLGATFLGT